MPGNRPKSHRQAAWILVVLLISAVIPAVSAESYTDLIDDAQTTSISTDISYDQRSTVPYLADSLRISFRDAATLQQTTTPPIGLICFAEGLRNLNGTVYARQVACTFTNTVSPYSTVVGTGQVSYQISPDRKSGYIAITFNDDWDPSGIADNNVRIVYNNLDRLAFNITQTVNHSVIPEGTAALMIMDNGKEWFVRGIHTYNGEKTFKNLITADKNDEIITIGVNRIIDTIPYNSSVKISGHKDPNTPYSDTIGLTNVSVSLPASDAPYTVEIYSPTMDKTYQKTYFGTSAPGIPDNASVIVYILNSQTGALLANSHLSILAAAGDPPELYEVVNKTLPGGTCTCTLQPTGGGFPNPDYYRVSVTADGYSAEMPYADITLDAGVSMTMVMGMQPTGGAPEDPGDTYIDVYVRDIYANPIADATVKMGVYTLKTNAAGYTLFDVPVNSTYAYTV